jgi:AraC-like DNA-binding protein
MRPRTLRRVIVVEPVPLAGLDDLPAPYAAEAPLAWSEANAVVRTAPPSAVVLVDLGGEAAGGEARLRDLLRAAPSATVVAAVELHPRRADEVERLLRLGVSEVIDRSAESSADAIAARLRLAHGRPLQLRVDEALAAWVGWEGHALLRAAAQVALEGGGALELARTLGVAPRTLTQHCTRAGLPPPRQVQAWMRILLACMLLDDPHRPVYAAAHACGYSTDRSLRRAVAAFLGADSTTLRRGGAFPRAAAAFRAVLRELPAAHAKRRPPQGRTP